MDNDMYFFDKVADSIKNNLLTTVPSAVGFTLEKERLKIILDTPSISFKKKEKAIITLFSYYVNQFRNDVNEIREIMDKQMDKPLVELLKEWNIDIVNVLDNKLHPVPLNDEDKINS